MKLVFATNNPHKLREVRQIAGERFEILSLSDIGCHEELPETGDTLFANSEQKAKYVKEHYGYDCFADDTGLMVKSLGGAPGVYSARYAGVTATPADNIEKLLAEMDGLQDRDASFKTVVTLCKGDGIVQFEGEVKGSITTSHYGTDGFGYDPIFRAKETGMTFANMTPEAKNEISHRGRAMRKLFDYLSKRD